MPAFINGKQGRYQAQIIEILPGTGCLGKEPMGRNRMLIDISADKLIRPNGKEVIMTCPEGAEVLNLLRTPSGHLMLPIDNSVTREA